MKKISIADLRKKKNLTSQQKPQNSVKKDLPKAFSHLRKRAMTPVTESILKYVDRFDLTKDNGEIGTPDMSISCLDVDFGFVDTENKRSDEDCNEFLGKDVLFNNPYSLSHMMKKLEVERYQYNSFFPDGKLLVVKEEDDYEFIRKKQNRSYAKEILNEGIMQLNKERYKKAIVSITRSLDFDNENPEAFYNRGLAYLQQNRIQRAYDDFEQVIKLNPNHSEAMKHYNQTKEKIMKYERQSSKIRDPFNKDFRISVDSLPSKFRSIMPMPQKRKRKGSKNNHPRNSVSNSVERRKRARSTDDFDGDREIMPSQKRRKTKYGEERITRYNNDHGKSLPPKRSRSPVRRPGEISKSVGRKKWVGGHGVREPPPVQNHQSLRPPERQQPLLVHTNNSLNEINLPPPNQQLVPNYGNIMESVGLPQQVPQIFQTSSVGANYQPPLLDLHGRPNKPPPASGPPSIIPPLQPLHPLPAMGALGQQQQQQPSFHHHPLPPPPPPPRHHLQEQQPLGQHHQTIIPPLSTTTRRTQPLQQPILERNDMFVRSRVSGNNTNNQVLNSHKYMPVSVKEKIQNFNEPGVNTPKKKKKKKRKKRTKKRRESIKTGGNINSSRRNVRSRGSQGGKNGQRRNPSVLVTSKQIPKTVGSSSSGKKKKRKRKKKKKKKVAVRKNALKDFGEPERIGKDKKERGRSDLSTRKRMKKSVSPPIGSGGRRAGNVFTPERDRGSRYSPRRRSPKREGRRYGGGKTSYNNNNRREGNQERVFHRNSSYSPSPHPRRFSPRRERRYSPSPKRERRFQPDTPPKRYVESPPRRGGRSPPRRSKSPPRRRNRRSTPPRRRYDREYDRKRF